MTAEAGYEEEDISQRQEEFIKANQLKSVGVMQLTLKLKLKEVLQDALRRLFVTQSNLKLKTRTLMNDILDCHQERPHVAELTVSLI